MSDSEAPRAPERSRSSTARPSSSGTKPNAADAQRAERLSLLNACFDVVMHAVARMRAAQGVLGGDLLVVLVDTQDALGKTITRRIGVLTDSLSQVEDDLHLPFDTCAMPLHLEVARRVFARHTDVLNFLAGEVPPEWTRVLAVAAGGWVMVVVPVVPLRPAPGDA